MLEMILASERSSARRKPSRLPSASVTSRPMIRLPKVACQRELSSTGQ